MCRIAHSVLEYRLGATSVVAFITKRTGLLRQKEVGSFFWSAGIGGGRRPQCLEASVRWRIGEVPRIPLPRTRMNSVASDVLRGYDKRVIQHTVLYDTDLPDHP